jgi:hypothetical protein
MSGLDASFDGTDRFPHPCLVQKGMPARRRLDALIRAGRGDIPLVRLKWQCARCRSGMTDFVVTGAHFGPKSRRPDFGQIGS